MDIFIIQLFLAIIIPFFVSIFAWILTYVIPYTWPSWVSNQIIKFSKKDTNDQIEIGIIINQLLKYDDWKRLMAMKKLKKIFKSKIKEIEAIESIKWNKSIENVRFMPLKEALDISEQAIKYLNGENQTLQKLLPDDNKNRFLKNKAFFEEKKDQLSETFTKNRDSKVWWYDDNKEFKIHYLKGKYGLSIDQFSVIVDLYDVSGGYTLIDEDNSMTPEKFLGETNIKKPIKYSDFALENIFQNIILYLSYPHSIKKKEIFSYRLALGLSSHKLSVDAIKDIIEEIDSQILTKDYKDIMKKLNL
jgi:hypothetical protein